MTQAPHAHPRRRLAATVGEAALWAVAILCLGYASSVVVARGTTEQRLGAELAALRSAPRAGDARHDAAPALVDASTRSAPADAPVPLAEGALVGRVLVPRLGIDAMIVEGTTPRLLDVAVGHLSETALPGNQGRVVLTAHRDSFFRPLQEVATGDEVLIQTPRADHRYEVVRTEIISPRDLRVLAPTPEQEVALVTCYPFHYIGPAPYRFVVYGRAIPAPAARGDASTQH